LELIGTVGTSKKQIFGFVESLSFNNNNNEEPIHQNLKTTVVALDVGRHSKLNYLFLNNQSLIFEMHDEAYW